MKAHRHSVCPRRVCACPNAWIGCVELMPFFDIARHARLRCQWRLVNCRLCCGAVVHMCKRLDHEEIHCKKRVITCDNCKLEVISEQISDHLHNECPERDVVCKIGCGKAYKAKQIVHHETNECVAPCKWDCGKVLGPPERRVLHELIEVRHSYRATILPSLQHALPTLVQQIK